MPSIAGTRALARGRASVRGQSRQLSAILTVLIVLVALLMRACH